MEVEILLMRHILVQGGKVVLAPRLTIKAKALEVHQIENKYALEYKHYV